jgi:virulence-associated protein VapD
VARRENRKFINFDLDTLGLIEVFGNKNRSQGYREIKRFMLRSGLEHRQYSGYISLRPMSYADTYDLIKDLKRQCPWLPKCVQKLDVTDYMAESDATEFIMDSQADGLDVPSL